MASGSILVSWIEETSWRGRPAAHTRGRASFITGTVSELVLILALM